ncbi:MAG: hypothetical protein AAB733_04290, partial [Patescibacteria group bacterium]
MMFSRAKIRWGVGLGIAAVAVAFIYRHWFRPGLLTGGDWGFHFPQTMLDWWPGWQLWDSGLNFGRILDQFFLQFSLYGWITKTFGVTYSISERVIWFGPLLVLLVAGMYGLAFAVTKRTLAATVATIIWAMNSYILLLAVGGQISVAISVAAIPVSLWALIVVLERGQWWRSILLGLALALQGVYDIRITYATIAAILLVSGVYCWIHRSEGWRGIAQTAWRLFPGFAFFVFLQLYWLLPWLMGGGVNIAAMGGESNWVSRLSFFRMEYILTATHPLWPMRQLGETSALDWIAMLNGVLFFVGLLWTARLRAFERLFLCSLWVFGAFFLLGGLPPAGPIYLWLFDYLPAFNMFRDPSKFFGFVAIPFAILMGWVVVELQRHLLEPSAVLKKFFHDHAIGSTVRKFGVWAIPVAIILLFSAQAGPGLLEEAGGTFASRSIPEEYRKTAEYLGANAEQWFRVLWTPYRHRFAYYTQQRPAVDLNEIAPQFESWTANEPAPRTSCSSYVQLLNPFLTRLMGVGTLVVPHDSDLERVNPHEACRRDQLKNIIGRFAFYKGYGDALPVNLYRHPEPLDWIYPSGGAMTSEPDPSLAENAELLPQDATRAPTWIPHIRKKETERPARYHEVEHLKQERKRLKDVGEDPDLARYSLNGIKQTDLPKDLPVATMMKIDGVDADQIVAVDGWLAPSGKLDHKGAEYPNALVSYRLDVPKSGMYQLSVQLRRDPARSTIRYAFDAPVSFGEKFSTNNPFLRQVQQHWSGVDLQKEFTLSGSEYAAYTGRVQSILAQPIAWQGTLEPIIAERTFRYELFSLGSVEWSAGTHTVTFWSHADGAHQNATIDYLVAAPQTVSFHSVPKLSWSRTNATTATIQVTKAQEPFLLNLLEDYHP